MKRFDAKSALAGLGAGILVTFALGAASSGPIGELGRYQMAGTESHAFVIDTATGKVWQGYYQTSLTGA